MSNNDSPELSPDAGIGEENTPSRFDTLKSRVRSQTKKIADTPKAIAGYLTGLSLIALITGLVFSPQTGFGVLMIVIGLLITGVVMFGDTVSNTNTRHRVVYYGTAVLFIVIGANYILQLTI